MYILKHLLDARCYLIRQDNMRIPKESFKIVMHEIEFFVLIVKL